MESFYWPAIGLGTGGLAVALFARGLARRRWTKTGLYVAAGCLAVALLHMVAPLRGTLDPAYPGYSFGLLSLAGGPAVGLVAGIFYLAATASLILTLDDARGRAMWLVAGLNAAVLATLGGYLAAGLAGLAPPFRIALGDYLEVPSLPATLIALAVLVGPFAVGLPWAARRAVRGR